MNLKLVEFLQEDDWHIIQVDINNPYAEMMLENIANVIIVGGNMNYLDNIDYGYKRIERLEMLFYYSNGKNIK